GLSCGLYRDLDELAAQWRVERTFHPTMSRDRANDLMTNWERAVRQAVAV
ncbi:MAG: glycerol kinase, partial [Rhizobiales bacterium]|nr:glycerol kinase [Rhizobacter sp.]